MRNLAMMAALVATIGISTLTLPAPAAADSGSIISMQRAVFIANRVGVVGINDVAFDDGQWEIEGSDVAGRSITVNVDGRTGAIVNVDRW